jgi:small-conductance mechanosensitive channel
VMGRAMGIALAQFDRIVIRVASREYRLIGISMLRIIIGFATIMFCLADYGSRQFFWGPNSYDNHSVASMEMPHFGFSLYLFSNSQLWFEFVFNLTIVVAAAYMVFGGKILTVAMAVLLWSLHLRNQDILEGGDNLAQILIIFMIFTHSNAYFAPRARRRRARLASNAGPSISTILHNFAAFLIVFQTAILYLVAGYWKITGTVWQNGVAMYYISRIAEFQMFAFFARIVSNAYLGTAICYYTIFIELAFAFAILSSRAWVRKVIILSVEGMHVGIMVFMGLVCFGLLMIGAGLRLPSR